MSCRIKYFIRAGVFIAFVMPGAASGVSVPSRFVTLDNSDNIVAAKSSFNGTKNNFAVARYLPTGTLDVTFGGAAIAAASVTALTNGTSNTSFSGAVFPVAGIVTTSLSQGDDIANSVAVDSSNRIIAAGSAADGLGLRSFALARYNPDGTLDPTFNPQNQTGFVITPVLGADSAIRGLVIDATGKLVAAGFTTQTNGTLILAVARYNIDGTLDTTFSTGGVQTGIAFTQVDTGSAIANAVTIDTAGNIVAAGTFNGNSFVVARYTPAGVLDTTFNPTGPQPGVVTTSSTLGTISGNSVIIDNSGKIVVSGVLTAPTGVLSFITVRYNPDGTLDTTFNPTGAISGVPGIVITTPPAIVPTLLVSGIEIDAADNIIISGYAKNIAFINQVSSVILNLILVRYLPDGTLDTTFNTTGTVPGIVVTDVSIQTATQVGLDLTTSAINPVVTGQVGFTSDVPSDITSGVLIDTGGNIVTAGFSNNGQINNDLVIGRYLATGVLDVLFNPTGVIPGIVFNNLAFNSVFFTTARGPSPVFTGGFGAPVAFGGLPLTPTLPVVAVIPEPMITFPTFGTVVPTDTPTITGTSLPAATVSLFMNNNMVGTTVANSDGIWFFRTANLPDADYTLHTIASDVIGNLSRPSEKTYFTVAAQAPAPPMILTPRTGSILPTGSFVIEGTTHPNMVVNLFLNNNPLGQVIADQTGRWVYRTEASLNSGSYRLYANATNAAGKTGRNSSLLRFTVNTSLSRPLLIFSPAYNAIVATPNVLISGTAGPRIPIALTINNRKLPPVMTDNLGNWRAMLPPLPEGKHTIVAHVLDTAGNPVTKSEPHVFTIDTKAKSIIKNAGNTRKHIIKEKNFILTGKATPGAVIKLYLDSKLFAEVKADKSGKWERDVMRVPELTENVHTITASEQAGKTATSFEFQFA